MNAQSARAVEFGQKAEKGGSADKKRYDMKSEITDITVDGLTAVETEIPIMICGFRQKGKVKRVKNVTLKNIDLSVTKRPFLLDKRLFIPEYASEYPEANRFKICLPTAYLSAMHRMCRFQIWSFAIRFQAKKSATSGI